MKFVVNLLKISCLGLILTLTACGSSPKHGNSYDRYSGGYEPGEKAYAEREAARLNRMQSFRLRAGGLFR